MVLLSFSRPPLIKIQDAHSQITEITHSQHLSCQESIFNIPHLHQQSFKKKARR